jgi:chloramphenicol-sensitive protein RarD
LWQGVGAYGLWGLVPLYLMTLEPAGPLEIVAVRIVFTLTFCLLLIAVTRSWAPFLAVFRAKRAFGSLALAAGLFGANWFVSIYAILAGQAVEVSLGAFISPLLSVLLGVLVLRERLRPLQWLSVAVGAIAVFALIAAYGRLPWLALIYALTWALYSLVKNRVGISVDAITSLTVESLVVAPIAIIILGWLGLTGALTLISFGAGHFALLAVGGVVTAFPMVLFNASARRLSMTILGLLSYLTPVIMLILAVTVLGEAVGPEKWIAFSLVWLALAILTVDMIMSSTASRRSTTRTATAHTDRGERLPVPTPADATDSRKQAL